MECLTMFITHRGATFAINYASFNPFPAAVPFYLHTSTPLADLFVNLFFIKHANSRYIWQVSHQLFPLREMNMHVQLTRRLFWRPYYRNLNPTLFLETFK